MVTPALFHNNLLTTIFLVLLLTACSRPRSAKVDAETIPSQISIPASDPGLQTVNGMLYKENHLVTGKVYRLYDGTADTFSVIHYREGKEHGTWEEYYPGRKKRLVRSYRDGRKTGLLQTWWPNGNRQWEYRFDEDEYEGLCREWNEAGLLVKRMYYHKGHEEGLQQWWYDNGKAKANYVIKDGRRYGLLGTKNCVNVSDSIFKE